MLRRIHLIVPAVALLATLAGARVAAPLPMLAVAVTVAALAVTVWLARVEDHRLDALAHRVSAFARGEAFVGGDGRAAVPSGGGAAWRRLVAAFDDVGTSLQQRFDDLADERARVQRILDDMPLAVLLFAEGGLAYANPTARSLFSAEHAVGRSPMRVLDVPGMADAVTESRETGRPVTVEVRRGERVLRARASVTAEAEVALVVTDLTESRRVEMIRRDFVTNASHELKTPVAGIQALSESLLLAWERDPDRAASMLERLRTESWRLAQLVRELLDLARLEEVATQPRRAVDLAAVVREEVARLEPLARERGLELRVEAAEPASMVAVPEDLRLIVANLLGNALQYNRPGGWVHTAVHRRGPAVQLTVADNGIGISAADRDRIFERFYRVDKGRSRAVGGTGLGLSLVRHSVQRHGGRITVDSVLGEGSTFRVVLPVASAEDAP